MKHITFLYYSQRTKKQLQIELKKQYNVAGFFYCSEKMFVKDQIKNLNLFELERDKN